MERRHGVARWERLLAVVQTWFGVYLPSSLLPGMEGLVELPGAHGHTQGVVAGDGGHTWSAGTGIWGPLSGTAGW